MIARRLQCIRRDGMIEKMEDFLQTRVPVFFGGVLNFNVNVAYYVDSDLCVDCSRVNDIIIDQYILEIM